MHPREINCGKVNSSKEMQTKAKKKNINNFRKTIADILAKLFSMAFASPNPP